MRIAFGGTYVPSSGGGGGGGGGEEPVEGQSESFTFPGPSSIPSGPEDNPLLELPVTVTSFGNGTIGYIKLKVYITAPDVSDLSIQLVHPRWNPEHYGSGMVGYHVVNYIFEGLASGVTDLGESAVQPLVFVWDNAAPSIVDYAQDQFGDFVVQDDWSTLYGLPMAGEWYLWVYDNGAPRETPVVVQFAELEIFDGNSIRPSEPATPNPDFEVTVDGLNLLLDATPSTGGVAPLRYFWEVYDEADELVGTPNSGFPTTDPNSEFEVPAEGNYMVTLRVQSDTNFAKQYLVKPVTVGTTPPPSTSNSVYSFDGMLWKTEDNSLLGPGLNLHTMWFSFPQAAFDNWAAEGVEWVRLLFWPKGIETAPGVYNEVALSYVKESAARAKLAGIKVLLCPFANTPVWGTNGAEAVARLPSHWLNNGGVNPTGPATPFGEFTGDILFNVFCSHAEGYVRHIMQEVAVPDDNVFAMGLVNEPDCETAGQVQRGTERMLAWLRDEDNGSDKLWFVATGRYSSQSSAAMYNEWSAITVWDNVVLIEHSYAVPQASGDDMYDATTGVREAPLGKYWNATDNVGSPNATSYSTAHKDSFLLHFDSHADFAASVGIPWVLEELGVRHNQVGTTAAMRLQWAIDIRDAAQTKRCASVCLWLGTEEFEQDEWGSNNGAPMRDDYAAILAFVPQP